LIFFNTKAQLTFRRIALIVFFVSHSRFGAMCKIGDFGMAGDIGSSDDGQEGDQKYMAPELLAFSEVKHPSADIFSLGLTLYEMASTLSFEVPSEGPRWHEVRRGGPLLFDHHHIPPSRDIALIALIRSMLNPDRDQRPTADDILRQAKVQQAGMECEEFLRDYIHDLEAFDFRQQEQEQASLQIYSVSTNQNNAASARHASTTAEKDDQTTTTVGGRQLRNCFSPMNRAVLPQVGPMLYSPEVAPS
jgi:serine/threonine protein kinase